MAGASKYPRLWDRTGSMVAVLKDAYDVVVTDELITGDSQGQEVLDFKLPHGSPNRALIKNEMVVEVGGSRFEVRTPWDGWDSSSPIAITSIHCEAYWYDLAEKDPLMIETAITDAHTAMTTILTGTGWTVGTVEPTTGSIQVLQPTSPLALLRLLPQSFGGELRFDNVARTVDLLTHRGSTTAVALYAHGRNLVGNARTEDTTNLVTRLYPYGSSSGTINGQSTNGVPIDISTVNAGLPYLEDYSFYDDNGWAHTIRAAVVTADNIMDPDTLKTWGQAQLAQMAKPAYSYTIQQSNTGENDVEPELGDVVRVHDGDLGIDVLARVQLRQRNILQPELTTYNIDTALYTLSQTLAVSTTGGTTIVQGVGDVTDTTTPAAPTSVSIVQAGVAGTGGTVQASETASWTQVTQNDDGSAITDLGGYEIRYAAGSGAWHYLRVPFTDTSVWLGLFEPNIALSVQVRAYDVNDNSSLWTSAPGTTTTDDNTPPNPPSAPQIDVATFPTIMRVYWDGKDNGGLPMPADLAYVEVHASTDATALATDANLVDTLLIAGYSDLSLPYGQNTYVWFIAMDTSHNASDPSIKAVGATRRLVDTDAIDAFVTARLMGPNVVDTANIKDLAVGTAKMTDLAVTTAKIGDLQVNDAKIGSMSVGKLTAGLLTADVTISARIKTADFGARAEMNGSGFHVFNSGGTEVATMAIIGGVPNLTVVGGQIQTSSGFPRVEISGASNTLRFYDSSGNAGTIMSEGVGNLTLRAPLGTFVQISNGSIGLNSGDVVLQAGFRFLKGATVILDTNNNMNVNSLIANGGQWSGSPLIRTPTLDGGVTITGAGIGMGGFNLTGMTGMPSNTGTAVVVASGTLSKSSASSERYKKSIRPLADPRRILKAEAVQFKYRRGMDWIGPDETYWGLIAEQVWQAGLDEIVILDNDGIDNVDYAKGWVPLLPIVKEHDDDIAALQQRVAHLEKELARA